MKKFLDSKWGKFVIVAACFCIGGILCTVISLFAPAKVEEPTLAEKMYKSYSTTIEKKRNDGTIVKHIVNGDPFFHGHYPFSEPMDISALNYDTDNWIYRITYCCGTNEEIVFCIGDLWYTFEGGVYTMGNMPYITAAIGGVFDRMNGTEYPTEDVTEATTEAQTNTPTTAPTEKATEPPGTTVSKGWDILSSDMEFERNADGVLVLDGAYLNHWVNGFLIAKNGVDFLSFHSGEPVWVTGKKENITITHEGIDFSIDFTWCTHLGEIGINCSVSRIPQGKPGVRYVSPIPGNDRFIKVELTDGKANHIYLVDLKTMDIIDPLAALDAKYSRDSTVEISPDADRAIIYIETKPAILELASGEITDLAELSGMENADTAYWASATQLVVITSRWMEPQLSYADAVLYDMTDGSVKELYNNAKYGWFMDVGGIEHYGRLYCYYDSNTKQTIFVDSISGMKGSVSHGFPMARQMGEYGVAYYDNEICFLLKPDGSTTPMFTVKAE